MKYYLCLLAVITASLLQAQTIPCAADLLHQIALQDSGYAQKHNLLEEQVYNFFKNKNPESENTGAVQTIPVVVHIIHDNGPENLSDARVQQAIQWLNQALANEGPYDRGSGTNTEIQLCLARRTPDGQATNGITRNQSPLTEIPNVTSYDVALKNINRWNTKDYLNIWLVRSICTTSSGCGISGYAYQPSYHGSGIDGIVLEAAFFGSTPGDMALLAHELGHYFGLYHTFEGGCSNANCLLYGDRICDTPPDQSTAAVPCGQTVNTCTTDTQSGFTTDQPDMSWNFMDYGIYECQHDFTADQAARMQFFLQGERKSLLKSKGCLPPCPAPAVAGFSVDSATVAAGTTVQFTNQSQNFGSLEWTIDGQLFSTATDPDFQFNTEGVFTVALQVQPLDGALCEPASFSMTIQVICPIVADFEISNQFPEPNEPVVLTNTSQNAIQFEWFVNGLSQGNALDTITFDQAGDYAIQLVAGNGLCSKTKNLLVIVSESDSCKSFNFIKSFHPPFIYTPYQTAISSLASDGSIYLACDADLGRTILLKTTAQGSLDWTKYFEDAGQIRDITATQDQGLALILGDLGTDAKIIKLSPEGTVLWSQVITQDFQDYYILNCLVPSADGGLIVAGTARLLNSGFPRAYLLKIGENGEQQWANTYHPTQAIFDITPTADGGYIAIGFDNSTIVMRFDASGNPLWTKRIYGLVSSAILPTADGNYLIGNRFAINACNSSTKNLAKINPEGDLLWIKQYEVGIFVYDLCFSSIIKSNYGGFWATGIINEWVNPSPHKYSFILHLDEEGDVLENQVFLADSFNFQFNDIQRQPGGGYILSGIQQDARGIILAKMDEAGKLGTCSPDTLSLTVSDTDLLGYLVNQAVYTAPSIQPNVVDLYDDIVVTEVVHCESRCDTLLNIEICDNNTDDDGDGLFDCLDPDCNCPFDPCQTKRADIWYFGKNSGLDFSKTPPAVLTDGQTNNVYGSAVATDLAGNLLFYSDGRRVYDRFHQAMPNGNLFPGTLPNISDVLILPYPESPGLYLLFVLTHSPSNTSGVLYSYVDMRLNNGHGDVVKSQKEIPLLQNVPGHLAIAATKRCNPEGYWIVVATEDFGIYSYNLSVNGIFASVAAIFPNITASGVGQMKFSPDGRRLAIAVPGEQAVYLMDFDKAQSGAAKNLQIISIPVTDEKPFGLEFSPSCRFLYVSYQDIIALGSFNSKVVQFDLDFRSTSDIINSATAIAPQTGNSSSENYTALQLGPDGKIYSISVLVDPLLPNLNVIHQPDRPGAACLFQENGQSLAPTPGTTAGLCNFPSDLFATPQIEFSEYQRDTFCIGQAANFRLRNVSCLVGAVTWESPDLDFVIILDNTDDITFLFTSTGTGQLIASAHGACGVFADTITITVLPQQTATFDLGPDQTVCENGVYTFSAGPGFEHYRWQDGATDSVYTTLFPGKYWVDVWDYCGNHYSDTIAVSIAPATVLDLGPNRQNCPETALTFYRPANFDSWQWLSNDFLPCDTCSNITISPTETTNYIVIAQTTDGCVSVDSLQIIVNDTIFLNLDTSSCKGQMIDLFGFNLPADTTAQLMLKASGPGQCDTLWTVQVSGLSLASSLLDTAICPESRFDYYGNLLAPGSITDFTFSSLNGCDSVVMVSVEALPGPTVTLPPDTTLRIGDHFQLSATVTGAGPFSYVWSPTGVLSCADCPNPLTAPESNTVYTLRVNDAYGCQVVDSLRVTIDFSCRHYPVTAFTPDNDGNNDWFFPMTDPCVKQVRRWQIFNRWGQVMFERQNFPPNQESLGWDGQNAPTDVYIWLAEIEYYDGKTETTKGEVTLIR